MKNVEQEIWPEWRSHSLCAAAVQEGGCIRASRNDTSVGGFMSVGGGYRANACVEAKLRSAPVQSFFSAECWVSQMAAKPVWNLNQMISLTRSWYSHPSLCRPKTKYGATGVTDSVRALQPSPVPVTEKRIPQNPSHCHKPLLYSYQEHDFLFGNQPSSTTWNTIAASISAKAVQDKRNSGQ